MHRKTDLYSRNLRLARTLFGVGKQQILLTPLEHLSAMHFDIGSGDLALLNNHWYVTHTGLLRMAKRKRCSGIHIEAADSLHDSAANLFVLKATVYPSKDCAGFVGYGDADPSNVSLMVRGAEMRIAETRAVDRALPGLLSPFPFLFAFLAWRPRAIGVFPHLCQGALEKELDLLIRRAVLPFRG